MKIRTLIRLNLAAAIITPLVVMLLIYGALEQFNAERLQCQQASEIRVAVNSLNLLLSEFVIHPGERVIQQWTFLQKELEAKLLRAGFDDPEERAAQERLIKLNAELRETSAAVIERFHAYLPLASHSHDQLTERRLLQLLDKLQHMRDVAVQVTDSTERQATAGLHLYARTTAASVGFLALIVALISIFTSRRLVPVLQRLQSGIRTIQNGHVDFRLRYESADELGALARAFDEMLDSREVASQALRASELRYRTLVENLPQKIFYKDSELRYLSCNPAYANDLGIKKEEILGKTDFDLYPEEMAEKYRADDRGVLELGQPMDLEEPYLVDGHEFWVQSIRVPIHDETGDCTGLLGIFWDITPRKEAEEQILQWNRELETQVEQRTVELQQSVAELKKEVAERKRIELSLRESEERLKRAILDAPFPVMIQADDGEILLISRSWTELTGFGPEDIPTIAHWTEKAYGERLVPGDEKWKKLYGLKEKTNQGEFVLNTKFGQQRVWDFSSAPLGRTVDGRHTVISMAVDVTARKEAESALKKSEKQYRSYFDLGQIGMAITSPEKGWVDVNARLCDILGYSSEELMKMTWAELTHPEDLDKDVARFNRLLTGEDDEYTLEKRFIHKDSKIIHAFIAVSCVRLPNGDPDYFVALVQDISQRKRAEERLAKTITDLKRSNLELEQFAYVASHDLQEPLRMVASYVQLLARRYRGQLDADADDFIDYAVTGANRMQAMINDLLAFSRAGRSKDSLVPVACEEVLATTLTNLQHSISENAATITHDPLPSVMGSFLQLTQVFQNLIANALKYHADAPPKVHISAQQEGPEWVFSIKDNGIGIDPQYFKRLFIIFQRLHGKEEYPGTGIGLALSKKIVERHGGRIWVESQPGKGSTFYFTLHGVDIHGQ